MNDIPVVNYPDPSAGDLSNSTLNMDRGIYLMESLWRNHTDKLEIGLSEQNCYNLQGLDELRNLTVELHNNISPHGRYLTSRKLIFGIGATQCLHAAIYAMRIKYGVNKVTTTTPGYYEYKTMVDMFHPLEWVDTSETSSDKLLEIVCTPNNPDGRIQSASTSSTYLIHDRVNHWPWFYPEITQFHQEDFSKDEISIFSYPKILGFSGSRVGYAWVKDPEIARLMKSYIVYNTHGLCTEGQLKCLKAIRILLPILDTYTNTLINYCKDRWSLLVDSVGVYNYMNSEQITLFNRSGPTAWIRCPKPAKEWLLEKFNIIATYGPEYGESEYYARLNMLAMPNEFDEFISRLVRG